MDYAGFAQLCGRSPIMREIMRAHNRIIPRSLVYTISGDVNMEKCTKIGSYHPHTHSPLLLLLRSP